MKLPLAASILPEEEEENFRFIWDGKHDNGRQLPSGIYLYSLEVMSQSGVHLYQDTKKMVLMK